MFRHFMCCELLSNLYFEILTTPHLTGEILKLRNKFVGGFLVAWDNTVTDMSHRVRSYGVEDRTLKNWCTVLKRFFQLPKLPRTTEQ